MKLFALSDLHLSLSAPYRPGDLQPPQLYKPMDRFGPNWENFLSRLEAAWCATVSADDWMLVAGDISWALTLNEARHDLDFIDALPGQKLLVKGNHDYWWQSLLRVRQTAGPSLHFLQHSAVDLGPWTVCGTRGWLLPEHADFKSDDQRLLNRELLRLEMACREAESIGKPTVVMMHYPPLDDAEHGSPFCQLLARFPLVSDCVYGHIHGEKAPAFEGEFEGIRYHNCSVDRLGFVPRLIFSE